MNKREAPFKNCSMKLNKLHLAIVAIIVTNLIWGASVPLFKWSLQDVPPFTFAFLRFFLASLILLPFTFHHLKISSKALLQLTLLAFLGFFLHISLLLFGLTLSSSLNAPIIASSAPIFLIIGGFFLLHEKIKIKTAIGTLISLIGICIVVLRPLIDTGFDSSIVGNILFILSTLTLVLYTLLLREYNLPYRATTITFWMFAIATAIFFPFFLWESGSSNVLSQLTFQGIAGILFGAIFTSVIAYVFYNFAIKRVPTNEIGVFLYIDPIVTALIAVPLLGEKITTLFIIGSIFVFLGIFVAEGRLHYHPLQKFKNNHSSDTDNASSS